MSALQWAEPLMLCARPLLNPGGYLDKIESQLFFTKVPNFFFTIIISVKTNNGTDVAYVKGSTNTNENNQRMVGANTNGQLPLCLLR